MKEEAEAGRLTIMSLFGCNCPTNVGDKRTERVCVGGGFEMQNSPQTRLFILIL